MSICVSIKPVSVRGRTETLRVIGKEAGLQRIDTFNPGDMLKVEMRCQSTGEAIAKMRMRKSAMITIFAKVFDEAAKNP